MPSLTRYHIKSGFVFLVVALLIRLFQAGNSMLGNNAYINALGPVYFHLFMVGWVSQLIFGIVFWMFPIYSQEKPHRSEWLGWFTFWSLNLGLVLRILAEPMLTLQPAAYWGWPLAISAIIQWLAGMGFVINVWSRVKAK
jgi:heme/copper-type cytochrome/quinol oxidase subunit 1